MIHLEGGILFPETLLSTTAFQVLAVVVALNTLVYVGLTISKLIPLPKPIHPQRVRDTLDRFGIEIDEESAVDEIPDRVLPETDDPYENMRIAIAKRDIPQAFALVGGLIVVLALGGFFFAGYSQLIDVFIEMLAGLAFLLISQILGRANFRARVNMWTWCLACLGLVVVMVWEAYRLDTQLPLTYTLIVMTAFAPVSVSWRPAMVSGVLMIGAVALAAFTVAGGEDVRIVVLSAIALAVSATLLRMRLIALNALADEEERSAALATTDVLTGALTRNGLLSLMPGIAALAARTDEDVCVMYFDIEQLARANEQYGVHYGDDVLRGVASAIREHVRQGDLVARWSGDEFLVAGIGNRPDAQVLAERIQQAVKATGLNLGRWPTTLAVGTSAGDPREVTFESLVAAAQSATFGRDVAVGAQD